MSTSNENPFPPLEFDDDQYAAALDDLAREAQGDEFKSAFPGLATAITTVADQLRARNRDSGKIREWSAAETQRLNALFHDA